MKNKRMTIWLLTFIMLLALIIQADVKVKAEDKQDTDYTVEESYTIRSMLETYTQGDLEIRTANPNDQGILIDEEEEEGLKVSGSASNINSAVFKFKKKFHFSGNRVARLAVNALAPKGKKCQIHFYLDQETEAFASISMLNQSYANNWSRDITINENILNKNIQGDHTISFQVITETEKDLTFLIRSIEFVQSGLPTVYLNLDESLGYVEDMNSAPNHDVECYGDMTIEVPAGYTYEFGEQAGNTSSKDTSNTYSLSFMRGRGNSTWSETKKPYKLKLDKKANIMGMGFNKHWALVANYFDDSKMRNQFTYWLTRTMGIDYAIECVPVDLVVNGIYFGNYFISETVRMDKNRVELDDLEKDEATRNSTDPETISGGYLLCYDSWGADASNLKIETRREFGLTLESPSFDGYTNETQYNYIKNYIQDTEDALFGDNFQNEDGVSYTEYMDIDSAVDYYWVQEFCMNDDAYESGSNYLYKPRNGKLYWGPLWDFDFGYNCDYRYNEVTKYMQKDKKWVKRLLEDPTFTQALADRWPDYRKVYLEACADGGQIDKYYENLKISMVYDNEKWEPYQGQSFVDAKERLKTFIKNRVAYIDSTYKNLVKKPAQLTLMVDGKEYKTYEAVNGQKVPLYCDGPAKAGYAFKGWLLLDKDGNETDTYLSYSSIMTGDLVAKAVYRSKSSTEVDRKIFLLSEDLYVDYSMQEEGRYRIVANAYPKRTGDKFTYISRDNDVVEVDDRGFFSILSDEKELVTVVVYCGELKTTCRIHICSSNGDEDSQIYKKSDFSIKQSSINLKVGQYQKLDIIHTEKEPLYMDYSWASDDTSIATVDRSGVVTAKKNGTTSIYLMDVTNTIIRKCKVTVGTSTNTVTKKTQTIIANTSVKKIRYNRLRKKNQTFQLKAKANTKLTFKKLKGNKKITVSRSGKVTVKKKFKKGTYTIQVRITAAASNSYKAASKTIRIKIKVK